MYRVEMAIAQDTHFKNGFGEGQAADAFGPLIPHTGIPHMAEPCRFDRERICDTRVEQRSTSLEDIDQQRGQSGRDGLLDLEPVRDGLIDRFGAA